MPPIMWYTCYTIVTNQDGSNDMNAKRRNPERRETEGGYP
jgi:hypothetical protein